MSVFSSTDTFQLSHLPSFPEVPMVILLSYMIHSWLLQYDYDDESTSSANVSQKKNRTGLIELPFMLPIKFPLVFQSTPHHSLSQPIQWNSNALVSTCVSSLIDAQEIALRFVSATITHLKFACCDAVDFLSHCFFDLLIRVAIELNVLCSLSSYV